MTEPIRPGGDVPPRFDPAADLGPVEPADSALPAASTPSTTAAPTTTTAPSGVVPLSEVIARPTPSSGRGTSLLLVLAGAIAVGGVAFAAGRLTAPAATASTAGSGIGQFRGDGQLPGNGRGFPGRGNGFGGITLGGTVTAITADSVTLDLASGTSITIPLDGSTAYHTATPATADAVTVGSEVSITPGARVANPNASLDPNASPGPGGGGISFGAATDVTVTVP